FELDHGRRDRPRARVVEEPHAAGFGGAAAGRGALMAGKLTRFLNLEKPRPASEDAPRPVANAARFGGEAPLALDESGEMLSLRCPSCEADNNRVAERCFNCQRALQTTEVHAWNE